MISWVNNKVVSVGKKTSMKDFRDKSLGDSLLLIDLLYSMDPAGILRGAEYMLNFSLSSRSGL